MNNTNSFSSSNILDTVEGILNDFHDLPMSIKTISNSEETISRLAINRAYLCAYMHVVNEFANNGISIIPHNQMRTSEYKRTSATIEDILMNYNGYFISTRLDTLFDLRKDADYCFEQDPNDPNRIWEFELADGFFAIAESRDIILEFDTEVQNKITTEKHL